jgi:hypothetical protein
MISHDTDYAKRLLGLAKTSQNYTQGTAIWPMALFPNLPHDVYHPVPYDFCVS